MNTPKSRHPSEERDGFRFRGGNNALDLAATLQGRLKPAPRELLATPADLGRWLVAAGFVPTPPAVTSQDLADARALRESIYALACGLQGSDRDAVALDTLNGFAAKPAAVPELQRDGSLQLQGDAAALLATLAREAVRLFGGHDATRIRQCQSPTCTLFFIDTSRSGERRWCSMSACGTKAKVGEFRRRKQATDASAQ